MNGLVKGGLVVAVLVALGGGGFVAYRFGPWSERLAPEPARQEAARAEAPAPAPENSVATPTASAATAPTETRATPPTPWPQPGPAEPASVPARPEPPGALRPTTAGADEPLGARPGVPERVVRLYEGMRPKEAATVLARLDPELSAEILVGMRERQAAKILAHLPPQRAADLTDRLARRARERSR
jgi:hypothetical protein